MLLNQRQLFTSKTSDHHFFIQQLQDEYPELKSKLCAKFTFIPTSMLISKYSSVVPLLACSPGCCCCCRRICYLDRSHLEPIHSSCTLDLKQGKHRQLQHPLCPPNPYTVLGQGHGFILASNC